MKESDEQATYQVLDVQNDAEFDAFFSRNETGIAMLPEPYGKASQSVFKPDAGDFAKWLRANAPLIPIEVRSAEHTLVLRSHDIWLPLIYLANNVALPIFLGLVTSYAYDRWKGALKGDKSKVHLTVMYKDKKTHVLKSLQYEGDVEGLQKVIKKFDPNKQ